MHSRLARTRFSAGWEERKHLQTIACASFLLFGEDLSAELHPRIWHRAQRTGSPHRGPQPLYEAVAKVLRDHARTHGMEPDVMVRLEDQVKAQRLAARRMVRESRFAQRTEMTPTGED